MKNNPYPPNLGDMKQKENNKLTLPKSDKSINPILIVVFQVRRNLRIWEDHLKKNRRQNCQGLIKLEIFQVHRIWGI